MGKGKRRGGRGDRERQGGGGGRAHKRNLRAVLKVKSDTVLSNVPICLGKMKKSGYKAEVRVSEERGK